MNYCDIKNIKQRRLAFLNDTANFYNSKNRATVTSKGVANSDGTYCVYSSTPTSPGCAIGRHLFSNVTHKLDSENGLNISAFTMEQLQQIPKWMLDMGTDFLFRVQQLHDEQLHWNENGLTASGQEKYQYIKDTYCR